MGNRTGRIAVLGAWLTAGALCFAAAAQAQTLIVSNASGEPGLSATFTVTLSSGGTSVAGTQNDIAFDPANIPVAAKANGKPNCTVNADIDKGATSFAFRPNGCSGTACTSIRALVLSTDNVDAIPDGSVLYTCTVNIASTASGTFPLTISGVILSDPAGNQIAGASGTNGSIAAGIVGPSPTPTVGEPTATPTTAPAACAAPAIQLPQVQGQAGAQGSINATLVAGSASVAGTQNDIGFAAPLSIAAKVNGKPDCTVNGDIDKGATSFAFRPNGCSGTACTSIRALVLSTDNVDPIPDGSVLYTCNVNIAVGAADGTYPLPLSGVILSDPQGNQIPVGGGSGCDGSVKLGIGPTNTPTQTPTAGPPTNTPTATSTPPPVTPPTSTPTAVPTNTRTPIRPTSTPTSGGAPTAAPFDDDGGCNISTTGGSSAGWLLLIPAIGLVVMRRRRR